MKSFLVPLFIYLAYINPVYAYEFDEHFSAEFLVSHGFQCQSVNARLPGPTFDLYGDISEFSDACRGALPARISPTLSDRLIYHCMGPPRIVFSSHQAREVHRSLLFSGLHHAF